MADSVNLHIMNKLEEFLRQFKIEEFLWTHFASELADQGISKTEIEQNKDNIKSRLHQFVDDKPSMYTCYPPYLIYSTGLSSPLRIKITIDPLSSAIQRSYSPIS